MNTPNYFHGRTASCLRSLDLFVHVNLTQNDLNGQVHMRCRGLRGLVVAATDSAPAQEDARQRCRSLESSSDLDSGSMTRDTRLKVARGAGQCRARHCSYRSCRACHQARDWSSPQPSDSPDRDGAGRDRSPAPAAIAWRSGTSGRGCHRRAPADGAVMFEVRQLTAERKSPESDDASSPAWRQAWQWPASWREISAADWHGRARLRALPNQPQPKGDPP